MWSLLALFAAVVASGPASPMAVAVGSTLVSTFPDGRSGELWLAQDGSYEGEGRRHDHTSGHWVYDKGRLCLRQSRPVPIPFSWCTVLPPDTEALKAGWTTKAPMGETIVVKLVQGRYDPMKPAR